MNESNFPDYNHSNMPTLDTSFSHVTALRKFPSKLKIGAISLYHNIRNNEIKHPECIVVALPALVFGLGMMGYDIYRNFISLASVLPTAGGIANLIAAYVGNEK